MTTPEHRSDWKRTGGRLAVDFLRTTGDYVLLVFGGTFLCLVISELAGGFFDQSRSPLPLVWFCAVFASLAALCLLPLAVLLFVGARLLQLAGLPVLLLRALGALVSAVTLVYLAVKPGFLIALAWYFGAAFWLLLCAALVLGFSFGAYLLVPTERGALRPVGRRHWLVLIPVLVTVLGYGSSYVRSLLDGPDQQLEVAFLRWEQGPQELAFASDEPFAPTLFAQELSLLRSAGLRGTLRLEGSAQHGTGPHARMVVVLASRPASPVVLLQPDRADIVYVQEGESWGRYPSEAPLQRRTLELYAPDESPVSTLYRVELANGTRSSGTAMTW